MNPELPMMPPRPKTSMPVFLGGAKQIIKKCIGTVWIFLAAQLALSLIGTGLLDGLVWLLGPVLGYYQLVAFYDTAAAFLDFCTGLIGGGLAWYWASGQLKIRVGNVLNVQKLDSSVLLWGPLLAYAMYMPLALGLNVTNIFLNYFGLAIPVSGELSGLTLLSNVFYILLTVVVAPVMEEIVFRGMILESMKKYSPLFALIFSSVLFALAHLNLYQGLPVFGMSLAFGLVYLKTGSLAASIYMHFVNNLLAVVASYLPGAETWLGILFVVFAVAGWIYFGSHFEEFKAAVKGPQSISYWKETFQCPSFWALTVVFAVISIALVISSSAAVYW